MMSEGNNKVDQTHQSTATMTPTAGPGAGWGMEGPTSTPTAPPAEPSTFSAFGLQHRTAVSSSSGEFEVFAAVSQLAILRQGGMFQLLGPFEYRIFDGYGRFLLKAVEVRGVTRPTQVTVLDSANRPVLNCTNESGAWVSSRWDIVASQTQTLLGSIERVWAFGGMTFYTLDVNRQVMFRINLVHQCCALPEVQIFSPPSNHLVGTIAFQDSTYFRFSVNFLTELANGQKAFLLAAAFFVRDVLRSRHRHRHHHLLHHHGHHHHHRRHHRIAHI